MDVPDMEAVMSAMETEAAADAMAYDGVVPETLVILVEPDRPRHWLGQPPKPGTSLKDTSARSLEPGSSPAARIA
jgi:hypothetical protein